MTQVINSPAASCTCGRRTARRSSTRPPGLRMNSMPATPRVAAIARRTGRVPGRAPVGGRSRRAGATPDLYGNLSLPAIIGGEPSDGPGPDRLIVPLTHVNSLIGFVVLAAPPEPFEPNYEDRDLLKMMGRHVAVHLAQYEADRRAASRQFEAYNRLTAFVMHDLRNLGAAGADRRERRNRTSAIRNWWTTPTRSDREFHRAHATAPGCSVEFAIVSIASSTNCGLRRCRSAFETISAS